VAEALSAEHRAMVLARLAGIEDELAEISTWLSGLGEDRAAEVLDCAARDAAAAGWTLERPRRARSRPGG
jgi:hypothetical protein